MSSCNYACCETCGEKVNYTGENDRYGFTYCTECHDLLIESLKNSRLAIEYLESNNHDAYAAFLLWLQNKSENISDELS